MIIIPIPLPLYAPRTLEVEIKTKKELIEESCARSIREGREEEFKRNKLIKKHLPLAERLEKSSDWKGAMEHYEIIGYYDRIRDLLSRQGRYKTLIDFLESLGDKKDRYYSEAASYCLKIGDDRRAIENYRKAQDFVKIGEIYEKRRDFTNAFEHYKGRWSLLDGSFRKLISLVDKQSGSGVIGRIKKQKLREQLRGFFKESPWLIAQLSDEEKNKVGLGLCEQFEIKYKEDLKMESKL